MYGVEILGYEGWVGCVVVVFKFLVLGYDGVFISEMFKMLVEYVMVNLFRYVLFFFF